MSKHLGIVHMGSGGHALLDILYDTTDSNKNHTFGANEKVGELASLYLAEWQKFYERNDIPVVYIAYRAMRDRDNGETIGDLIQNAVETISATGDVKSIWSNPAVT